MTTKNECLMCQYTYRRYRQWPTKNQLNLILQNERCHFMPAIFLCKYGQPVAHGRPNSFFIVYFRYSEDDCVHTRFASGFPVCMQAFKAETPF